MSVYLFGEYKHNLNASGRVSIPPAFREAIGTTVVLVPGPDGQLNGFAPEGFQEYRETLFDKDGGFDKRNPNHAKIMTSMSRSAKMASFDKAGRLLVSEEHRAAAGLEGTVSIVGEGDHFSIWNPEKLDAYTEDANTSFYRHDD